LYDYRQRKMMSIKPKKRYIPGINGFKAIAALMVVLYHMKFSFAKGGLLGVTIFFVTSGFLITRNLLAEAKKTGKVDFPEFWKRRIRRLLPAVICLITVTVILTAIFNRVLFTKALPDIPSALFGYNNWWQIFNKVSYFENAGAPSPLTHFWSLAIEIQFYLIISLLFVLVAAKNNRKQLLTLIFAMLSVISVILMLGLFDPSADPSRVYYGTDTRIFSLLAGSFVALFEPQLRKRTGIVSEIAGIVSIAALLAMSAMISGYSSFMFRGGQIIATLLSVIIVWALLKRNGILSKTLSLPPLRILGEYSFGIYLWHYPVILLLSGGQKAGILIVVCEFLLTALFCVLSHFFVEVPYSTGVVSKSIRILLSEPETEKQRLRKEKVRTVNAPIIAGQMALVVCALLCAAFVPKENALANKDELERQAEQAAQIKDEKMKERQETEAEPEDVPAEEPEETPEETPAEPPAKRTDEEICNDIDILMIGDSVSLGATNSFYEVFPNSILDAEVNRYSTESYSIFGTYQSENGWDGDAVIFSLGANGPLYDSLETMRDMVPADTPLFLMTARAPHTEWAESNNQEMKDFAAANANTYIIDWYAASEGHDEYFAEDGTHLNYSGAEGYAACIREAILEVFRESN